MLNYVHYVVLSVHRLKLTASLVTSSLEGGTQGDAVAATGKARTSSGGRLQPTTTDELGGLGTVKARKPGNDGRRWESGNSGN
jgi:hypothetical protein